MKMWHKGESLFSYQMKKAAATETSKNESSLFNCQGYGLLSHCWLFSNISSSLVVGLNVVAVVKADLVQKIIFQPVRNFFFHRDWLNFRSTCLYVTLVFSSLWYWNNCSLCTSLQGFKVPLSPVSPNLGNTWARDKLGHTSARKETQDGVRRSRVWILSSQENSVWAGLS